MVVQDIQEVSQYLKLKFRLDLQWMDTRVAFYNIKKDEALNSLTLEEQLTLWTPTIIFWNTEQQLKTVNDMESFASILRSGKGSIISREVNEDIEVFKGSENMITFSRVYSIKFFCNYQMAWYPFDQQTCSMEYIFDGVLNNYADLLPGALNFTGKKELTQYFVKKYVIKKTSIQMKSAVVVEVTLGRRLLGIFLTIFFPTILLNIIGYATNYFKEFFFEAVITVNLTSMLVLSTMFISISNSLPKTSYMKMVDVWLLFNLLYPFLVVLLHTYMDTLRSEEGEENMEQDTSTKTKKDGSKIDKKSRRLALMQRVSIVYMPACCLFFASMYWFVGLKQAEAF